MNSYSICEYDLSADKILVSYNENDDPEVSIVDQELNTAYQINSIPKCLLNEEDNEFRESVSFKKLALLFASLATKSNMFEYSELVRAAKRPAEKQVPPSMSEIESLWRTMLLQLSF